ncbi:Photosystem I P700 chlorophyll a apoprotein A1, partial [Glycine soja]
WIGGFLIVGVAAHAAIFMAFTVVAVGGKVALLPIPLGTVDFLVHHIHAFTIHVTVLILLKGVLFARSSRLIPDKTNLGFRFPCDGLGRGGACQVSAWDLVFFGLFWMYNSILIEEILRRVPLPLMGGSMISYAHRHPSGRGYWQELIESIVWAHNKLKVAPATQPRALSIVQGRAVGVTHYLLGGIATTWAFFLARIIAVG